MNVICEGPHAPDQDSRMIDPDEVQKLLQNSLVKRWLTNEEAMEYLGLSRSTLNRYRMEGKIPYSKVGQNVYYRLEDIEELLEENLR